MQIIPLYRYTRSDGGVTVSIVKPESDYIELFRLVADEGKVLTDGSTITACIDTDSSSAWSEIIDPGEEGENEELTETQQKALAYDILTGVAE